VKLTFYILPSGQNDSAQDLMQDYIKKINRFVPIELIALKPTKIKGDRANEKKLQESLTLSQATVKHSRNILFDEAGKTFTDSMQFSKGLVKQLSSNDVAFYIGGAFGVQKEHKSKFSELWSLSSLTTNHHLAAVFALEQIYRGLTIWKNHPYHNE
jgi:23S rRNA (pseudouridine1915-N3)-methyltransferase